MFISGIQTNIVVIGGSHHNTLGVVRALGQKGIKPMTIVISQGRNSFVLKSKYVSSGRLLSSEEEAVGYVRNVFSNTGCKTIILSCSDAVTCILDKHYDEMKADFFFFNAGEQGRLNKLTNKYEMQKLAVESGLNVPYTILLKNRGISDDMIYPCVIKDVDNVNGSKNDMKIFYCQEDLIHFLSERGYSHDSLVQQYISKKSEFQLIGCSVREGDKIRLIIPGFTNILRSQPVTNTGFLEYYPISELEYDREACNKFLEECNYTGLFSLEFVRDEKGKDYFLEINFRNDGNAYVVTKSGVNLPYIYVLYVLGLDYANELNRLVRKQVSMPVIKDFKTVLQHRVSICQWLKDLHRTNCFFYFDIQDPRPLLHYILETVEQQFKQKKHSENQ